MAKKNPDQFAALLRPVPTRVVSAKTLCTRCQQEINSRGWISHCASHDMADAKAAGVPYVRPARPDAVKPARRKAVPAKRVSKHGPKAKNRFK